MDQARPHPFVGVPFFRKCGHLPRSSLLIVNPYYGKRL